MAFRQKSGAYFRSKPGGKGWHWLCPAPLSELEAERRRDVGGQAPPIAQEQPGGRGVFFVLVEPVKRKEVEVQTAEAESRRIAALNANSGATRYMEAMALVNISEAIKDGKVQTIVVPYDFKGIVNVSSRPVTPQAQQ